MADHQFEQKVSQQLADFKLKPSADVWQKVETQLEEDKRRRRWFFYLPIAALFIGGLLYAVWPGEKPAKADVAVQSNTNNTTATTVEKNTNESPLTKTGSSSTTTANEPVTSEKEVNENNLQAQPKIAESIQQNSNVTKSNRPKVKATNTTSFAVTTQKPAAKDEVIVEKESVRNETSAENTADVIDAKQTEQKTDSVLIDQPIVSKTDSVQISEPSTTVVDSISGKPSVQVPTISKRKWQMGLSINVGTSDIRGSLFPGSGTKSLYFSDAFASPGSNNGGMGGVTRIVQYEYTVRPALQVGAGIMLRKSFKKRHSFVTGLQYQYSSYSVKQRQRIDTFILANNYFSNISMKEKEVQFRMHAINAPLEMEFKIADIKKGKLLFNAGIHNWFIISSTQTDTLSGFRYVAESSRSTAYSGSGTTVKETKATIYQPQLYLSPAFEWKGKKTSSQLGLYLDYGLRRAYQSSGKDYWWQTGIRYRIFFNNK